MDKERLKNTILAVAHQILSTCSQEKLENALAAFLMGDPVTLKPHKPIILDDYDVLVEKLNRALKYRPRRICKTAPLPLAGETIFPNVFTVTVPMVMEVENLSNMERQILVQNLDKVLLMTVHDPKRSKEKVTCRARIGVPIRHLTEEQKEFAKAETDYITEHPNIFYKTEILMAYLIFMPKMIHHSFKKYVARSAFFGIPP